MIIILEFNKLQNSPNKYIRDIGFQLEELHDSLSDSEQKIKLREITEEFYNVIDELDGEIMKLEEELDDLRCGFLNNEIVAIELTFENCEAVKFDREYIEFIHLDNINNSITGNETYIYEYCNVKDVAILIKSEANINDNFVATSYGNENLPFQKILRWSDIVAVDVIYENRENKCMYVDWKEVSNGLNSYQKSKLDDNGNLYIVISKNKEIMDYFEC